MTRHEELKADPAFRQAVQAVRGAASVLSGVQMSYDEAELLAMFALVTFANGGGLTDPSLRCLARFLPETERTAETARRH
ncbi:hypothetical protein [Methylobacterium oxalidis]|uniref:Uncharacterized protein n=1 Tax=Methylobacterium oxalidis TaxID=944322 RepID=A0A512J4V0_9HYPH|nr:hypothetical protein [Methylobacterium oxalidis]GEP04940.1 hypothetical protein MOX02_29780 [Methylobacterium oxalidis]GJE35164.1 hypothetical protein LDDCCGHA_5382 [Methylobacterium oxalidis]GLS63677.1 hypothetical protein GCM10007888_20580 [Methylobacterium oxalidis]